MSILNKFNKKSPKKDESTNADYSKQIKKLEKRLNEYDDVLDSYNRLFNILFIDYDIKPKGILKNTQDLCQELLNFIVNVCNKHGIEYWMDYGNLLGAVRHGGFIPWDDDMDIGMMRKDYIKFHKIFGEEIEKNGLSDNIDVRIYKNDRVLFTQIMYISPEIGGIFAGLDIFPYDFITGYDENSEELFRQEKIKFKRHIKDGKDPEEGIAEYIKNFNVSLEPTEYVVAGVESVRSPFSRYAFKILDSSKIFPLSTINFNGTDYSCPNDNDYYLTEIYGNYREIHKVIEQHGRVKNLRKQKGVLELSEFHINKLKEINDLFQ